MIREHNPLLHTLDHEVTLKRILGLSQIGCRLEGRDGHIWIEGDCDDEYSCCLLHKWLAEAGVMLNNKIYGGMLEALDTVDHALSLCGKPPLLQQFPGFGHMDQMFLGEPGVCASRISRVDPCTGGLY